MKILLRAIATLLFAALPALTAAPLRAANGDARSAADHTAKTPAPEPKMAAHAAASGDALLEALLTELDRSKAQLKMDQVAPPYYIEYRVNDVDDYSAEAAFGALRENQRVRYRVLRVVVRIGDYKQDSYYGQGMGETNILPLDDDPIALAPPDLAGYRRRLQIRRAGAHRKTGGFEAVQRRSESGG